MRQGTVLNLRPRTLLGLQRATEHARVRSGRECGDNNTLRRDWLASNMGTLHTRRLEVCV